MDISILYSQPHKLISIRHFYIIVWVMGFFFVYPSITFQYTFPYIWSHIYYGGYKSITLTTFISYHRMFLRHQNRFAHFYITTQKKTIPQHTNYLNIPNEWRHEYVYREKIKLFKTHHATTKTSTGIFFVCP